jgi:uncharacterized protein RhaS with RHS repeats
MIEDGATYHCLFDGNGNVGQLIGASDGSVVARYEYDPFGKAIVENGSVENAVRFSAKYVDAETDLYYYGYRYYSAESGR